jgi:hypothetical protein
MPARCDGPGGAAERERRLRGELFRQFVRGGAQAAVDQSPKVEPMRPAPQQWPSTAAMLNVQEVLPGPAPDLAPLQGGRPERG